jgi:6-pyruvoyltetrahydropterin/6-carboxytetrahydropterin synthase
MRNPWYPVPSPRRSNHPGNWLTVARKARFAAAHFLSLPELSDAENFRRFGPSSNTLAHGHNYELEVFVSGPLDVDTGMVVNLKDLKAILNDMVVTPLDFKNLNRQVPFFENRLTTLENMAQLLWLSLQPRLEALSLELSGLKALESHDLYVEYYGGAPEPFAPPNTASWFAETNFAETKHLSDNKTNSTHSGNQAAERGSATMNENNTTPEIPFEASAGLVYFTRGYDFPAGHRLHNPEWSDEKNQQVFRRCNNPNGHGHNYSLEVTVVGTPEPRMGMVVDLHALDMTVQRVILDRVDHCNFNVDVDFMQGIIPTAENIVRAFWKELAPQIPSPARLARLRLVETPNNAAEYRGE